MDINELIFPKILRVIQGLDSMSFDNDYSVPVTNERIKILGALLEVMS